MAGITRAGLAARKALRVHWPKAHANFYPYNGTWHIGDGYGGYECDLGSGTTINEAWIEAARLEVERKAYRDNFAERGHDSAAT